MCEKQAETHKNKDTVGLFGHVRGTQVLDPLEVRLLA